jgi:hypothetical protein
VALTKKTAGAIVDAVVRDADSQASINIRPSDSPATRVVPEAWGITGALRNVGLILKFENPEDPKVARTVCTGIANVTMLAIDKALKSTPGIPEVNLVTTIDRYLLAAHTATLLKMKDGSNYVFDWHKSLNVHNPWIYKVEDWKQGHGGVLFDAFTGW